MSLINCKFELKLKWTSHCIFSAVRADNTDHNSNNIILTIKDTKLYVPGITLSPKENQKVLRPLTKRFVYWNEYKSKSENTNTTNEY